MLVHAITRRPLCPVRPSPEESSGWSPVPTDDLGGPQNALHRRLRPTRDGLDTERRFAFGRATFVVIADRM
jgi:hypothetical protein